MAATTPVRPRSIVTCAKSDGGMPSHAFQASAIGRRVPASRRARLSCPLLRGLPAHKLSVGKRGRRALSCAPCRCVPFFRVLSSCWSCPVVPGAPALCPTVGEVTLSLRWCHHRRQGKAVPMTGGRVTPQTRTPRTIRPRSLLPHPETPHRLRSTPCPKA